MSMVGQCRVSTDDTLKYKIVTTSFSASDAGLEDSTLRLEISRHYQPDSEMFLMFHGSLIHSFIAKISFQTQRNACLSGLLLRTRFKLHDYEGRVWWTRTMLRTSQKQWEILCGATSPNLDMILQNISGWR